MGMEVFTGAAYGAAIQEGSKQVVGLVSKAIEFRESRRNLGSTVQRAIPVAQEIIRFNQELGRPEEERASLLEDLQEGQNVFNAYSNVPWWQCFCFPCFQTKVKEQLEALDRSEVNLLPLVARDVLETLWTVKNGIHGRQLNSLFKPPSKPDVVGLGLDNPLSLFNKLKKQLLQSGTSVLVLSGLAGYGKTTLATLLCWDDDVRGKFGENILFLTVSKTSNLKTIVQSLFQHYGFVMPDLDLADDNRCAISHLKNLAREIMKSPMMLVLDDVWPNSECLIEAFKFQGLSDYKILVTSRFNVLGFEPAYRMEPLCLEDSITLLRQLALPNEGSSSSLSDDYVEKIALTPQIARYCYGSPLVLELVGGSLKKERVHVWRQKERKLSRGHPIVKTHTEMRTIFKKYLDDALEDKPIIKECFTDLGLFPEDQRIPVAALIDIWTERRPHELDDDLEQRQELEEEDAVSIVYDLTDRHLANLVVRRAVGINLGDYCNHHFLMQHDLIREMVEAIQEPCGQRKRLMFDMNENNWSQQRQQNTVAHTLSISTCKMSTPELEDFVKTELVEVLVLNLRSKKFTLPESIRKMNELKVLIVTNYDDLYCSLSNNFELLGSLSCLKRIRLERVSVTTLGKWQNLRKLSLYSCNTREAFESDSIPISEALPNLVELCIDYCKDLVTLPNGLCDITSIEKLSITRCMRFIALPHDIGNLENLKTLRLSSCAVLEEIPASIGKLFQLRFLDISGCVSLRNLPEEIGNLRNLESFHMVGCCSCKISSSVTKLKNLKDVRCDEETAILWKDDFKPSLPNLKIKEANDHSLFIFNDI